MSKLNETSNIAVLGLILLIITAVAGGILGVVNKVTEEPRMVQLEKAKKEAIQIVLPNATDFSDVALDDQYPNIKEIYQSESGSYAIKVLTKGYGGEIALFVGVNSTGQVTGIHMLTHNETPGLGANANNESFKEQFIDLGPEDIKVTKAEPKEQEIQALSGATITSKAVTSGVNIALDYVRNTSSGGGK